MHPLQTFLQNPLRLKQDERDRAHLRSLFHDLSNAPGPHYLALRRYLDSYPESFFDRSAFQLTRDWLWSRLTHNPSELKSHLSTQDSQLSLAFLHLREINAQEWHDEPLARRDEFDLVRLIERYINPNYLRLVEGVFATLLRLFAYFSRIDRSKGTDGLNIHSIVEEVQRTAMAPLVNSYQHTMRNGIAHGRITYLQNKIRYEDSNGHLVVLPLQDVIQIFDDILDTCNGISAAIKVFFAVHRDMGFTAPRELQIEELQEETRTPWWAIEGCVTGQIDSRSQLTVFARPNSRNRSKIQISAIQSGILSEYFAPGFDRYFLSLASPKALPGWASFDGNQLRSARESGSQGLEDYFLCIEDRLIFYVPRPFALPRVLERIDTLLTSIRMNWPIAMDNLRKQLDHPIILARNAGAHRNSWGAVVNGDVVLQEISAEEIVRIVRQHRRRILNAVVKQARKGVFRNPAAYLPVAFSQISVFQRNYRKRRLVSYGLGSDLVCTVRLHRIERIKSPDIIGSTVEVDGQWRIAWNRAWLKDTGVSLS